MPGAIAPASGSFRGLRHPSTVIYSHSSSLSLCLSKSPVIRHTEVNSSLISIFWQPSPPKTRNTTNSKRKQGFVIAEAVRNQRSLACRIIYKKHQPPLHTIDLIITIISLTHHFSTPTQPQPLAVHYSNQSTLNSFNISAPHPQNGLLNIPLKHLQGSRVVTIPKDSPRGRASNNRFWS